MPIFGWLLSGKLSIDSCLRPRPRPIHFFVIPFSRPKRWDDASNAIQPGQAFSSTSHHHIRQQSVDFYVLLLNGDHLRTRPCLHLNFLIWLALAPQTREPTAALPNLTVRALRKPMKWRHHELVVPLA